jgi:hypothetical protein
MVTFRFPGDLLVTRGPGRARAPDGATKGQRTRIHLLNAAFELFSTRGLELEHLTPYRALFGVLLRHQLSVGAFLSYFEGDDTGSKRKRCARGARSTRVAIRAGSSRSRSAPSSTSWCFVRTESMPSFRGASWEPWSAWSPPP